MAEFDLEQRGTHLKCRTATAVSDTHSYLMASCTQTSGTPRTLVAVHTKVRGTAEACTDGIPGEGKAVGTVDIVAGAAEYVEGLPDSFGVVVDCLVLNESLVAGENLDGGEEATVDGVVAAVF